MSSTTLHSSSACGPSASPEEGPPPGQALQGPPKSQVLAGNSNGSELQGGNPPKQPCSMNARWAEPIRV